MVDVVASIQSAIDVAGKLRALSKKIEDADFTMLLADLTGDLADAKMEVANLKTQLAKAIEENQALVKKLDQRSSGKPTLSDGAYKFEGSMPFCVERPCLISLMPG